MKEPRNEKFNKACIYCGSEHCFNDKTAHTRPPTTTYMLGAVTLEEIIEVALEAIERTPYCASGNCDIGPLKCHKHTPDLMAMANIVFREKLTPKAVKIPTIEEAMTESCKERRLWEMKRLEPVWQGIDKYLEAQGLDLGETYRKAAEKGDLCDSEDIFVFNVLSTTGKNTCQK